MADRSGKRKSRAQLSKRRVPTLGYYIIVTDTKETERNYMLGLRDSIPAEMQGKLVIKVSKAGLTNLVDEALEMASLIPQYGEPWIIFDRDEVKGFDQIIAQAKENGVRVGWSNPCFETWLGAYFGEMSASQNSMVCCDKFGEAFLRKTGQEYSKSDGDIYSKLCRFGDEKKAISIAKRKLGEHERNGKVNPSEMNPATTVHVLVEEIQGKVRSE